MRRKMGPFVAVAALFVSVSSTQAQEMDVGSGVLQLPTVESVAKVAPPQFGDVPVSTQLMWTHDFDVENRLEGNLGLLTVSLPLSGHSPAPADME